MKNILIVVDKGDIWEVTGTTIQSDDYVVNHDMVYELPVDEQGIAMYQYIKAMLSTNQIQFLKETTGRLIQEDLILIPYDADMVYREKVIHKGREYLNTRLGIHSIFEFFDYIMLNNTLSAAGFVVTEKNRREKYLEIIDTGDIDLIDSLEQYLNALDRLNIINGWYRTYKEFEKNIYMADDEEAVDECYKIFVQIFE